MRDLIRKHVEVALDAITRAQVELSFVFPCDLNQAQDDAITKSRRELQLVASRLSLLEDE